MFQRQYEAPVDLVYLNNLISSKTHEILKVKLAITLTFYALLKMHKCTRDPPGRPIFSDIDSLTHKASKIIDNYLRPHVEPLPCFLKDTIHLLTILDNTHVTDDTILASIDVEALYSSIPHDKGLLIYASFLRERSNEYHKYN